MSMSLFSGLGNLGVPTDSRYLGVANSATLIRSFALKPCGVGVRLLDSWRQ
jgi:hypothetical protein